MVKVVLVTSGQPSLNPRLVKEADALADAGYLVTVIYSHWNDWGSNFNEQIFPQKKWKAIRAGGHPVENSIVYTLSKLMHKLAKLLFYNLHYGGDYAIARAGYFLLKKAKKHRADLYIGHNLGALPAVVFAAKKYGAKCGFDAEDFHRQEVSDDKNTVAYKTAKYLEDKYYPGLDYLTTSSPLITAANEGLYPEKSPVTILNVFPKNTSAKQRVPNLAKPIKLFWFSQTIGSHRGLEAVAKALKVLKGMPFELHLLGQINAQIKQNFIDTELCGLVNVFFYDPILPDELIPFAAQFDIGIAAETSRPLNRDICLTNKLFTYLQAGLAIVASDTTAQKKFMEEYPDVGKIYDKENSQSLTAMLSAYQTNRGLLFETCEASLKLGQQTLNWENESVKFLSLVNATLNEN